LIRDTHFQGARFAVRIPEKKSEDGFIIASYCETVEEGEIRLQVLRQLKGRRAMTGATLDPLPDDYKPKKRRA
jgi:hypothetical protein